MSDNKQPYRLAYYAKEPAVDNEILSIGEILKKRLAVVKRRRTMEAKKNVGLSDGITRTQPTKGRKKK